MKKTPNGGRKETAYDCEAEVTDGLEFVTEAELRTHHAQILYTRPGEIGFRFSGDMRALLDLRTVQSVSLVKHFDIPRPRALLSNVHLPVLIAQIETVLRLSPAGVFESLYIAAAGAESSVMRRIKQTVAEQTGVAIGDDKGDLWVRIRPGRGGWETVVRLSPRPLVTRAWRVCNLEGALNAATAQAMVILSQPKADDVFVNLGCGSGTLLIERISHSRCKAAIGFDNQADHLRCAQANLQASGQSERVHLHVADITRLPLEGSSASALCADLPFGQLTGTHQENERLYPPALQEAARIAKPEARFVLITHEVRLMDSLLSQSTNWSLEQLIRINLRGLHPRIYVLQRR